MGRKNVYSAQGKWQSSGEYGCPGSSSRHLHFQYKKFTAELPIMAPSCLIFSWCLALCFLYHWLMVRSVTVLDAFPWYVNINWRQYPTTQMTNILKIHHQIGWHHPKPNNTLSFATFPTKSSISHSHRDGQRFEALSSLHFLLPTTCEKMKSDEKVFTCSEEGLLQAAVNSASDRSQEKWGQQSTKPDLSCGLEANGNLCLYLTQAEPCKRVNLCPLAFLTVP